MKENNTSPQIASLADAFKTYRLQVLINPTEDQLTKSYFAFYSGAASFARILENTGKRCGIPQALEAARLMHEELNAFEAEMMKPGDSNVTIP